MNGFHNVSFPLSLAFGASGGPSRRTDITRLASGAEHRNTPHILSRRKYNAGAGVKTLNQLSDLIVFFEARKGQLHSFRFRDPLDFKSCAPSDDVSATDQFISTGDGVTARFHLAKNYADSASDYNRPISKPVPGSVKIAVDGAEISEDNYLVDSESGEVILNSPPPANSTITAGFEFDVPVRFDTDHLDVALQAFGAGQVINIPLIEVADHA